MHQTWHYSGVAPQAPAEAASLVPSSLTSASPSVPAEAKTLRFWQSFFDECATPAGMLRDSNATDTTGVDKTFALSRFNSAQRGFAEQRCMPFTLQPAPGIMRLLINSSLAAAMIVCAQCIPQAIVSTISVPKAFTRIRRYIACVWVVRVHPVSPFEHKKSLFLDEVGSVGISSGMHAEDRPASSG